MQKVTLLNAVNPPLVVNDDENTDGPNDNKELQNVMLLLIITLPCVRTLLHNVVWPYVFSALQNVALLLTNNDPNVSRFW